MGFLKNSTNKSKIFFIILFVLVIIVTGEISILLKQRADTPIMLSKSQKIDTTHWRTYHNEDLEFEVKYPQDWTSDINEEVNEGTEKIAIQQQYIFSSDVVSFNIIVNENSAETLYFAKLLERLAKDKLRENKFVDVLREANLVYAIDEYFSISGFSGVIFYTNRKHYRSTTLPVMGEAMLKRGETISF